MACAGKDDWNADVDDLYPVNVCHLATMKDGTGAAVEAETVDADADDEVADASAQTRIAEHVAVDVVGQK